MQDYRMETFLTLCETMNYTKTAQSLFITQPAVTGHIRFLEKTYGVKLFTYIGKTLSLTTQGKQLYRYALAARADDQHMKQRLAALPGDKRTLRLGATKTIGAYCMPKITADYLTVYPNVNLKIHVDNTRVLLHLLEQGEIAFALIEGFFENNQYVSVPIADVDFIGVCGTAHPLAGKEITFTDLLPHRLLLREEGSGTRDIAEAILREFNLQVTDFNRRLETGSFALINKLVQQNLGFTFVYKDVAADGIKAGHAVQLKLKNFSAKRQFRLVSLNDRLYKEEKEAFYRFLKKNAYFNM